MSTFTIHSETKLFGVFGDPIKHSKSPIMLNRAFRETGYDGVYTALHVKADKLGDAVAGIRAMNFKGANVTIPHKVEVMQYLDEIDDAARFIGAVNTIVNDNGVWKGYNTDGIGYVRSLKEETGIQLSGKQIVVLGAGGAARGVLYALAQEKPARIVIANRTPSKAAELAEHLQAFAEVEAVQMDELPHILKQADLLINHTPVGMHPNVEDIPIDPDLLTPSMIVSDLIYNPLKTKLLQEAEKRGCTTHGGLGMFIYQGAYAFEYWTGLPAPIKAMRETVLESLQSS
ncbi:shikimate dehydrogenase [Marinicrinis lubricantis]|uniref:Shikimate dehydrogenase (NADP(+)) n=1 Tax=Marinicrinis lubricantis TaxID=2086470 RepID=A0ABW1IVL1_9BACL